MPKKKKKHHKIQQKLKMQQTAEMMASSLPPSDGGEPLASATRLEQEGMLLIDFQKEDQIKAAYRNEELQLRSVASFSNYACDQTSNFEMFGARPKYSQTAENFSYTERKALEAPPPTSTVSHQEQTARSYLSQLQIFEYELNQAKAAYNAYMIDGRQNKFSENAILGPFPEGRTHPSSPEGKTHPMEDIVSGESEYRELPTSYLSHRHAQHNYAATNAELPKTAITAPSTGQSNLQERAEMHYDLSERMLTLHRSFSNLSLTNAESRAQMPHLSPQTHVLAPPGDARVLQSGAQQDPVQQRQVTVPPAAHFNVAPQILQPQAHTHVPSAAQPGPIPGPVPGPPPVQQLPQPAPQTIIHQQGSTVAPLAGESKLKVSGQNYRAWVSEVGLLLRREGTLQMVLDPPDQPWTPEIRNLETKACTTLLMSMDTELQITFAPDATAYQIWVQLENCYRPISLQSSCLLMSEFHSLKLNPGERIGGHLTKLKSMRKDLGERNVPIGDIQMVVIIINSLNYEWKNAIAKINQMPIHQRTVDNVCRALVEEEALMLATPHLRGPFASRAPTKRPFRGRTYVPRTPRCACKYSHDIFSETNQKVLKNHELSGLNEDEVCVLLLQNDPFLLPDVCGAYNKGEGSCTQGDNCSRLHICRYFLKGECRFPRCKRSHNLLDPHATSLLLSEGLDRDTILNCQTICSARIAAFMKELNSRDRPLNCAPAADKERLNTRPKNERPPPINPNNFVKVGQPDQGGQGAVSLKTPSAEKGRSDEICLHYVWQFCKNKNNCSMIHYDLPYRWQIFTSNGWKDLPRREEIEKAYCDPNITSFPDLHLDFITMTSVTVPIRRLSTVSSVTKEAKFVMTTKWLWYWMNDLGQWIEYGKQERQFQPATLTSDDLENLFLAEPDGSIQFEAGSQKYVLSFKNMTQINLNYPTKREVRRRPKFVSSEDVKTKKGWQKGDPVTPPGPCNRPQYQPVAQRLNVDRATTGMLQRSHTATTAPAPTPSPVVAPVYPPNWDLTALPAIGYQAINLNKGSPEFVKIENHFQMTMKNSNIRKIERIQNPSLWQVYQWQKEQMKKKKGGQKIDERLLFHGTSPSKLQAICVDNFDWRICGTNGTVYGKGSYFARDANYSDNYCQAKDDEKVMFVAQVLVGEYAVGRPIYTRPPAKLTGVLDTYDSCVDRTVNPSVFVIFEKHQAYPAYLIFYSEEKKCILS